MLVDPHIDAMLHITHRLRPLDEKEVFAIRYDNDPSKLADDFMASCSPGWIACDDRTREPIYAFGMYPLRPGVWSMWGFGTPHWPRVALSVTRMFRKVLCPIASDLGHRFECICLAEKTDAIRWLKHIGLEEEAHLRGFGRNGEDYKLLVWRA